MGIYLIIFLALHLGGRYYNCEPNERRTVDENEDFWWSEDERCGDVEREDLDLDDDDKDPVEFDGLLTF